MIISAVYPPEFTFSATTSQDLACGLAALGDQVAVLAPYPNKPAGKLFAGYRRRLYTRSRAPEGFDLIHCFTTFAPESRMLSRLFENVTFGMASSLKLLFTQKPDVMYVNTWPIFAASMTMVVARLRGIPVVLSVQDLYPESLAQQGRVSRRSFVYRVLHAIDSFVTRTAKKVVVVSDKFLAPHLEDRRLSIDAVDVIYNWGNPDAIQIDSTASANYRASLGVPNDAKIFLYGGNIGPASGAETLLEGFGLLHDVEKAHLVIAGSGSRLEACREIASRLRLNRVHFHSPWHGSETSQVLGAANVLLLPTQGQQSIVSMPSKLITYLFSGRPVLASVLPDSETAIFIQRAGAGWIVSPDSAGELAGVIRRIVAEVSQEQLHDMGERGKSFATANLSRASNLPRLISKLQEVALRRTPATLVRTRSSSDSTY
jgi:glycosyltransferase involved in cell wall biosynthesis